MNGKVKREEQRLEKLRKLNKIYHLIQSDPDLECALTAHEDPEVVVSRAGEAYMWAISYSPEVLVYMCIIRNRETGSEAYVECAGDRPGMLFNLIQRSLRIESCRPQGS